LTGTLTQGSGILGSVFGGFLANGGTAMGGRSYVVGERGPELFTPGRTGSVTPNNALGGSNIVVNVDASGSNVEGDDQQSKALGAAIGAAVQAELIKQKRPGGLLS
jgi:phage-related minor tail protein